MVSDFVRPLESSRYRFPKARLGVDLTQLNGFELHDKQLGIMGMGDIGTRVAKRARAFGMRIAYSNRRKISDCGDADFIPDPLHLLRTSDVFLLSCPSTDETRRFINAQSLAVAKPPLILVNVGRGDLVNDEDLIAALPNG